MIHHQGPNKINILICAQWTWPEWCVCVQKSVAESVCSLPCRRQLKERKRSLIYIVAARCMAANVAAYITASISAKLQCNFLTPHFFPHPITKTTPHGYFWWDSELRRGNEGEEGEGCLWHNLSPPLFSPLLLSPPSSLLINFHQDCWASRTISIKFPWIKPTYKFLSPSCLSNTKFQISFCF